MNILDYQQALFIAFNPILLLLLAIWLIARIVSALSGILQDATRYVRELFRRR